MTFILLNGVILRTDLIAVLFVNGNNSVRCEYLNGASMNISGHKTPEEAFEALKEYEKILRGENKPKQN